MKTVRYMHAQHAKGNLKIKLYTERRGAHRSYRNKQMSFFFFVIRKLKRKMNERIKYMKKNQTIQLKKINKIPISLFVLPVRFEPPLPLAIALAIESSSTTKEKMKKHTHSIHINKSGSSISRSNIANILAVYNMHMVYLSLKLHANV